MSDAPQLIEGRSCAGCALCCKLAEIEALGKPPGQWCPHCPTRDGCAIHGRHPEECRAFHCGWLTVPGLGPEWRPADSGIVLAAELNGARMTALVDPDAPDAWRAEPFYSQIRAWAQAAAAHRGQLVIRIGRRVIVVLPDTETDLGEVGPDEVIVTEIVPRPGGISYRALKLPRSDPRAAGLP